MSTWLTKLTARHVRDLQPYQSARRLFASDGEGTAQLWLNANEAPNASDVVINSELFNRYPDCQPTSLINAYANYAEVEANQVIATRGADEGIELIIRAFCQPGESQILVCPPTYGMYAISAETFNVGVKTAPLNDDFTLDLPAIKAFQHDVNVVFICSPNNPTGTLVNQADIIDVLETYRDSAIVVVDEAYIEFSSQSTQIDLLKRFDNLVILRTLSKGFALAGIRCGFTIASAEIITTLLKVIAPYPIPDPVAQVAKQALSTGGLQTMRSRVNHLSASLDDITQRIMQVPGLEIVGAQAGNFVLFRHPKNPQLMQFLVAKKIYIRDQSKQLALNNCLRITVGSDEQNTILLTAIFDFFESEGVLPNTSDDTRIPL